ncbi:MAG: hypothetical protein A3E25_17860 [Burkholderiales bacterium RIFCSPHIGHO2_12_FULL_69_20]|nr:MAG: hypothetical protein A3E25_17860 [Burkholderiales bacterium RIFCSPHIGHO2_12_FULL_69_20]
MVTGNSMLTVETDIQPAQFAQDPAEERAGSVLWLMLVCLNVSRPGSASGLVVRSVLATGYPAVTDAEVELAGKVLEAYGLATVDTEARGPAWTLTKLGIDVVEYRRPTVGPVARPSVRRW